MKISNYLKQLEKKENKRTDKIRQEQLGSLKLKYEFLESIRNIEILGGDILKLSKKAINGSINNREDEAKIFLAEAFEKIKSFDSNLSELRERFKNEREKIESNDLQKITIDKLRGNFLSAKEEYLEAKILFSYLKKGLIYKPKEKLLNDFIPYAGGLSDFCGELLRKARLNVIKKGNSKKEIKKYYRDTKAIYQVLSGFSFSNKSGIRRKVEQLKEYIKGFENILYDLRNK